LQTSIENKIAIKKIVEAIRDNNRFLIVAHSNPDGDSVGSQVALELAIEALGKNAIIFSEDKIPDNYCFLSDGRNVIYSLPNIDDFDVVFILDCSELKRVGKSFQEISSAKLLMNIDHHYSNMGFCHISVIDSKASATAELVYAVISELGITITPDIANALYAGILTDSGGFCYSSTTSVSLQIASRLVEAGAIPQLVSENIYANSPLAKIKLFSQALLSLTVCANGKIGYLVVKQEDFAKTGALPEHTEGLVDLPRSIKGVDVSILFTQVETNYFKISMRSQGDINVAEVAKAFDGGGHINAAACRCYGLFEELSDKIIASIEKILD